MTKTPNPNPLEEWLEENRYEYEDDPDLGSALYSFAQALEERLKQLENKIDERK